MRIAEQQLDVITATIEPNEVQILQDAGADLLPHLEGMSEQQFLDVVSERGNLLKEDLPQITEFLGNMATHFGAKVAIIDLPVETASGIPATPKEHLAHGELNLFPPDIYTVGY